MLHQFADVQFICMFTLICCSHWQGFVAWIISTTVYPAFAMTFLSPCTSNKVCFDARCPSMQWDQFCCPVCCRHVNLFNHCPHLLVKSWITLVRWSEVPTSLFLLSYLSMPESYHVHCPPQRCMRWFLFCCLSPASIFSRNVNSQLQRLTLATLLLLPRLISRPCLISHLSTSPAHSLQKRTRNFPNWQQFGMISMLNLLASTHGGACAATNYSSLSTQQGLSCIWQKRRTWILQSVLLLSPKNMHSGTLICFTTQ